MPDPRLAGAEEEALRPAAGKQELEVVEHPDACRRVGARGRRAGAAAKRGVSIVLEDPANLMALRKNVAELLEDGATAGLKAAFSELSLPNIGNSDAARIIEESRK